MSTLYVRVNNTNVTDITNNTEGESKIHLGVKYIHGKDNVIFREDDNGFITVERFRGHDLVYKYTFRENGTYMITTLFVSEYRTTSSTYRSIYNFLKKNFHEGFLLESSDTIDGPYEIVFSSWVDISFNYKFTVKINDKLLNKESVDELKICLLNMKEFDLLELHRLVGGKSIYIDKIAVNRLRTLPNVYERSAW